MTFKLVVVKSFLGFKRGDVITDDAKMNSVIADGYAQSVVRVNVGS